MTTYKSLKSLCESLDMPFYEIPELSDQELNITPEFESNTRTGGFEGFFHSEETKKHMSEQRKGRVFTDEWRSKMSATRKGKTLKESTKKRMSESVTGRNNPFYGKKHSQETISNLSGENNSQFGSSWYNDGVKNIKIAKGQEVPDGLIRGRINNWRKV